MSKRMLNKGTNFTHRQYLTPLAKGQCAYVMNVN